MRETCDVVVLGLGAMGASSLFHLAKAGAKAIGVEQHEVPHAFGSSYGSSRVIRKAYFEDARYVPMLQRSYQLWRELEHESGTSLYTKTGCINLGPREQRDMRSLLATVNQHGLAHELLDARAIRERFPAFRVDDDIVGLFEDDAGILQPERCTATHVEGAVRRGARVHVQERVIDVRERKGGVDVVTDKRSIACGHVVMSMGPWLPSTTLASVAAIAAKMRATRQMQLWFAPPNETFAHGAFPVFIQFGREGEGTYYGMPAHAGNGVKVCRHGDGVTTTPDTIDREARAADVEDVRGYLRRALPALAEEPLTRSAACMYTMTPDAHFVVAALGDEKRVVVLGGFSGHGFKMASALGEIASELATKGRSTLDISLFDPSRLFF